MMWSLITVLFHLGEGTGESRLIIKNHLLAFTGRSGSTVRGQEVQSYCVPRAAELIQPVDSLREWFIWWELGEGIGTIPLPRETQEEAPVHNPVVPVPGGWLDKAWDGAVGYVSKPHSLGLYAQLLSY